jgi:hypothetical protein
MRLRDELAREQSEIIAKSLGVVTAPVERRPRRELTQREKEERAKKTRWEAARKARAREAEMKPNDFLNTGRVLQACEVLKRQKPYDGPRVIEHEDYVDVMPEFVDYVMPEEIAKALDLPVAFVEQVLGAHWT